MPSLKEASMHTIFLRGKKYLNWNLINQPGAIMSMDVNLLEDRIKELEKENAALRLNAGARTEGATVSVPEQLKPLFDIAQQTVNNYFVEIKMEPTKGTIEINDQRYILVRASAMSKDFLDTIQNLYADRGEAEAITIGKNFLFDIAHTLGMNDAKNFHAKMNLTEPIAKLSAGPVHFAYTGWAFVDIRPESSPTPDDNFYLLYDHPYSFEADSWQRSGRTSTTPVCIMNAGYSSGWCEESFGIPLTAVEVTCVAKGDERCTFIMSPPHMIQAHIDQFHVKSGDNARKQASYDIPTFFERKNIEEELQRSRRLAEESAQAKEDFLANMSHELRTPLGSILGFTELLEKTDTDASQQEYIDSIRNSGKSLLSIINDILDLSKLDAGRFAIEAIPFDLSAVLHSVKNMFSEKAKSKGLTFTVSEMVQHNVVGDAARLRQVLINLVGNAIKFTDEGSVHLTCLSDSPDETIVNIHFKVADTGIGIPEEKLELIFERFTQADSNISRRFGGTGLGLAISKQLVELMGGYIHVKSETSVGTEFSFSLPFVKTTQVVSSNTYTAPLEAANSANKTILIVEDNPLNQKLTSLILNNNGFNFLMAGNGLEAIEILKTHSADLILMDIQMPVMDGYEATCYIRDEMHINIPIVAITAHALAAEKEKCIQKGINDYLPKPFSEADLLKTISYWINKNKVAQGTSNEKLTDLTFLRNQTRNNEAVIREIITLFIHQNPQDIAGLKTAIESGDYKAVYKQAHSLKSGLALFGLDRHAGESLTKLEAIAQEEGPVEEMKTHFTTIENCCKQALQELKNELT